MARPPRTDIARTRRIRVVLGATCYADAEGAMGIAVELARQVGADLYGLLVQDDAILTAAKTMRARAVSFSGEPEIGITESAMLRAYRADARRFEEKLSGAARLARIAAEFRATRGRLPDALLQQAGAGGVAVFGFKRATRDSGSVVLILGRDRAPPDFAGPLAAGLHKRLIVLTGAARAGGGAVWNMFPAPETLVCDGPEALLKRLGALSPAAVVIAADPAELPPAKRIVEAARCPVILAAPAAE